MEGRRLSRRDFTLLASSAAAGFLLGGFLGYLAVSKEIAEKTLTLTKTKTSTQTIYSTFTETLTKTQTVTQTETITETVTEKPEIVIKAELGKGYVENAKDIDVAIKLYCDAELDDLKAYYKNASIEGVLNKDNFARKEDGYYASFLTKQEPGEQFVRIEAEKDGAKAEKLLSISVGLSDEEIENSSVGREGIKTLWKDLLESDLPIKDVKTLEQILRKENEIVNAAKVNQISRASSLYLKELASYLHSIQKTMKMF